MRKPLIALAVAVGLLVTAPSAGAHIYWSSYDGANSTVGRADLDGKNVNRSLVTGIYNGGGVATDGSHIYWGESGSSPTMAAIGQANPDGSSPDHAYLSGATFCAIYSNMVAPTTTDLFWQSSTCSSGGSTINHHSGAGYGYAGSSSNYSCGFDIDANHVYYSERRYIVRANLDGSSPDPTWLDLGAGNEACAVAVDAGHVYWSYSLPGSSYPTAVNAHGIGRANINGDEGTIQPGFLPGTFFGGTGSGSADIAIEGAFIYWINQQDYNATPYTASGTIARANLDGTGVDLDFVSNITFPNGLDVDSAGPPPASPTPPCTVCRPVPVIGGVGTSNSRFAPGSGSTTIHGRTKATGRDKGVPTGTVFTYTLDVDAAVEVVINNVKAGRRVKGKCVKPSKKNAKKPKCDLTVVTLFRNGVAGDNELPFTGRIKGKALKPGRYKAVFTASSGGEDSAPASVSFKIVSPK